ncbi:hypothetical protein BC567DRAFT_276023, partial [Phyllosticta citribraziliensis]
TSYLTNHPHHQQTPKTTHKNASTPDPLPDHLPRHNIPRRVAEANRPAGRKRPQDPRRNAAHLRVRLPGAGRRRRAVAVVVRAAARVGGAGVRALVGARRRDRRRAGQRRRRVRPRPDVVCAVGAGGERRRRLQLRARHGAGQGGGEGGSGCRCQGGRACGGGDGQAGAGHCYGVVDGSRRAESQACRRLFVYYLHIDNDDDASGRTTRHSSPLLCAQVDRGAGPREHAHRLRHEHGRLGQRQRRGSVCVAAVGQGAQAGGADQQGRAAGRARRGRGEVDDVEVV